MKRKLSKENSSCLSRGVFKFDSILVGVGGALLIGAKIAEVVSPDKMSLFALFGLIFPVALLIFSIGLILRIARGSWREWLGPVILIFILKSSISLTVGGWNTVSDVEPEHEISLGSFNVRRMDEFEWLKGDDTRKEILDWLSDHPKDIWCFQEFPKSMEGVISKALGGAQMSFSTTGAGPATATKLPVVHSEVWTSPSGGTARGIITDVISEGDTLRIFNIHLQSVGLVSEDYDAVRDGPDAQEGKRLWGRLKYAYSLRAAQSIAISNELDLSPYPVILCGDFNDTPVSYVLKTMKCSNSQNLVDAFAAAGKGLGSTYVGDIPWLRIDYILHASNLETREFETWDVELSDHRPITALLGW